MNGTLQTRLAALAGLLFLPMTASSTAQRLNVVIQWNQAALQGVRDSTLGPPMVARALFILNNCIYDAWAAYDDTAVGTVYGGSLRRPSGEHTDANKSQAISLAAYRAATDLFPWDKQSVFDPLMAELGYDASYVSTNPSLPDGIGNLACNSILTKIHNDGSNQLGNLTPSGVLYADYTGFVAANPAITVPLGPSYNYASLDPNYWQPLSYFNGKAFATQAFVGSQWQNVTPFALSSSSEYRAYAAQFGPAQYGSHAYQQQAQELINISAHLNDREKMIAEYWANGPHSELPPGHWNLFGQYVSMRDHHSVDDDAKMFFALSAALHDAAIACWDAKRAWDSVRPITAIPELFHGQQIESWGGPGRGRVWMDGGDWMPYQPATFPTPPFPSYFSGHSTFSAAGATVLSEWTGSDKFGASATFEAGSSVIEPGTTPGSTLVLSWDTFSDAANEAGMSRRYGGIHFKADDLTGRDIGRKIGTQAFRKAMTYFDGTPAASTRGN
jgi:PAP2 superfamily